MKSLFGDGPDPSVHRSLSGRLWPDPLTGGILGQEAVEEGGVLHHILQTGFLRSMVLHGPPGCGKTSFTRLLLRLHGLRHSTLRCSEVSSAEIRKAVDRARGDRAAGGRHVLVLEEIDRLGKTQQDLLIAPVDEGDLFLLGLSNENPVRTFLPALASRVLIVGFSPLSPDSLSTILERALSLLAKESGREVTIEDTGRNLLVERAGGDARRMLGSLEWAFELDRKSAGEKQGVLITARSVLRSMGQTGGLHFDRESHFNLISAFIKSVRNHDPDGALHWLARMIESGEDPLYIARRLVILSAEDIGLAEPQALTVATACMTSVSAIGLPEARIILSETAIYLALCPKSNTAYQAVDRALAAVKSGFLPPVPPFFTVQGKSLYLYPPDQPDGLSPQRSLPLGVTYYKPGSSGREPTLSRNGDKPSDV